MLRMSPDEVKAGDVVQILDVHGREGWVGAFVLVTEVKEWGVQGFVHVVQTHESCASAYIRLIWDHIEWIGPAEMVKPDPDLVDRVEIDDTIEA
jgi:hypothetical protein